MTETAPQYETDAIFARVKAARAVAETLRHVNAEAMNTIEELTRLVESYRLREWAREGRGE